MEEEDDNSWKEAGGEPEVTPVFSSVTNDKATSRLTLVLVGDTNSIEIGPKNILVDHDEQTNIEQFSSRMYDLCGRHISVINMLGLQSTDKLPLNTVHAFLLLLPNGQHSSQYTSGVQWLEKAFGKESLAYLMTVVTHRSDEKCESAVTDLKDNSSFNEKRFHTCQNSMMDEHEIVALLDKIDVMVSENDPHCYSGLMCDDNKEQKDQLDHKSDKEERTDSFESQQNPTADDLKERKDKTECDPENKPDDDEHSEKNDANKTAGGQAEDKSVKPSTSNEKVEDLEDRTDETEYDPEKKPDDAEHSEKNDDNKTAGGQAEDKSVKPSIGNEKVDDLEDRTDETECDPEKKPDDDEHSEKNDDNKTAGGQAEDKSVKLSIGNEKADDLKERTDKTECDPENKPDDAEHTEKNDDNKTAGGQAEDQSVKLSIGNEKVDDLEDRTDETETWKDANKTAGGQAEDKSVKPSTTNKKDANMDKTGNKDKQSMNIPEVVNRMEQHQRDIKSLFSRLHLQDKYEQKLTPADFLKISPLVNQHHDTSEKDLAHTVLQRLMMIDHRARYIPVKQNSTKVSHPEPQNTDTEDDGVDAFYKKSVDSNQPKQSHVHPMDVQMAVFHCSDSFLKQNMITKLSQCQYALPLLVPDPVTMDIECPLWTFRQIMKSWKKTETKDDSKTVTMKSMPIYKAETPMVSFLRLGSLSLSKSQLMNTLINDRHSTFFHRNCPGSTKSRHLMDGVAEIAWYCPAGKPNDAFIDCIAFCNLHGDALMIEKQREILMEKSSVNVVLVETLEKSDKNTAVISTLLKSEKPFICLIVNDDCSVKKTKEGKYKMGLKDKSQSDVCEELKGIIGKILCGSHSSFQLETMSEVSGIRVDEDDTVCQKGKTAAMEIVNLFKGMDVSKIKDKYLPCQGRLWHDWCKTNKEQYHLKGNIENGNIEKEKCKKQQEMKKIRQQQCSASCSEVMKLFIESLSSLPPKEKQYFLKWIRIFLDALSTDDLSSILQKYDEKWSEVLDLKKKHDKSDQLTIKQTELEKISKKLQSATFGLEHIFREMGQIYEAHKSLQKQTKKVKTDWSKYPELAAELMISGHPMELMDGDAGHVPLTWISNLLNEVIKKLGDKRVFVLSVLGLQSSGKSTMLNSMFGLQFAVSAGRCTKGAFMQLVKVSEEMKKDLKFDYVLVVDTEGLRALELAGNATLQHDNELATFVIGLGNMTLINIFGENPADMQDILQIVVQAFMRMKRVKLSPSCVFVHQNVSDIGAAEKNMDGKRRLQEKLDQMAKLAAKEEEYVAECFNDIIKFDVQKDVKYFAQLWEGSPPMAPPNPGYSESIQDLKNIILSKASKSDRMTLSQFKSNIKDLWNALLNESFVFSFKNTLEIAVYRRLEVQYGNWTWALRSNMLTIENKLHTMIENGKLDNVELNYLHGEMRKTYEEIKNKMSTFFEGDKDKEMLVQWQGRFDINIKQFHDELVRAVKRKLDEVIQQKAACKKMDDKKTEFENKLLQKSKELAHQLKDKAKDEKELLRQFNEVWRVWITEFTGDLKPIEDINLENDHYTILQTLSIEWTPIQECKNSGKYKNISKIGDYRNYVILNKHQHLCDKSQQFPDNETEKKQGTLKTIFTHVMKFVRLQSASQKETPGSRGGLTYEEQQLIRTLIDDVEQDSLSNIKTTPVATRGYSQTYLQEVANYVKEKVTEFESKQKYVLKKEFTVDLLLYVFDKVGSWISESHKKFQLNNDVHTYLENKKKEYYNIFRSFCKGNSSAVVLGELICEKLKVSIVKAVCNKTAIDLAGEMRCNFPAFNGNRLNLEKHVLQSLAEKEDFDAFINYIRRPKEQVESFIKEEVEKYIFTDNKTQAQETVKKNVEDISNLVSQAVFHATEKVKTQRGNTDMWLKEFSSLLKENDLLTFDISSENFSDINKFDFLKQEIEKGLESITKELSILSLDTMKEFKRDQVLIDQLCKCCWVQCPFCGAVCTNTVENHDDDHSVPFHRSFAVIGTNYYKSVEMCIDFCTTRVASDTSFHLSHDSDETFPYKEYRKAGPRFANWRITPDGSKLLYWKWFVYEFQKQLEDHYNLKFEGHGKIPIEWKTSKEEAIKSLDEMYS